MHRNNTQRLWDCGFTSKEEGNKDEGSLSYTDIYFIFLKNLKKKKKELTNSRFASSIFTWARDGFF